MSSAREVLTREALDACVTPHLTCLLRCARRVLPSDDLAWDAVSETLTRLWRRGFLPDDARRVLLGLVFRASLHERRRLLRRDRHERHAAHARDVHDPAQCRDPHCEAEQREFETALQAAIDALPPRIAGALRLRAVLGLDYEEIAARLAIPIGTVRSRLHHARALLQRALLRDDDDARRFHRTRTRDAALGPCT